MSASENSSEVGWPVTRKAALLCMVGLTLLAAISYAPLLFDLLAGLLSRGYPLSVISVDFANYWMAGQMVMRGLHHDLFSISTYFVHMQSTFGADYPIHNWGYPPHFLLLLWPLGLLSFKTALVAFLASTFLLFVLSVMVFRRVYAPNSAVSVLVLAILSYALMMVHATQNGFLTGALLLFGLAWMKFRPAAAGFAFALLTIKPHLGLLIPVLLLLDRNWRPVAWAAFFTVALIGLSAALYGASSWTAYLTHTVADQRAVMTNWDGIFLRMMPTAFASMRTLGFTADVAYLVQWPVSIAGAALVWWAWREQGDPLQRVLTLACGTFLVSPYAFNYDMGALGAIAAMLAGSQPLNRFALISVCVIAGMSPSLMNLGRSGLPVAPILLMVALAALAIHAQQTRRITPGHSEPVAA